MKNLFSVVALMVALFFFSSGSAVAQSGNGNGSGGNNGAAIAAFNQNCSHSGPVEATDPQVLIICLDGGAITRVFIVPKINCNQVDCTLIRIGILGYVDFDCEGNVMNVVCN